MTDQLIPKPVQPSETRKRSLSLDAWSVLIALALVALVRLGVLKHVAW